jgi:hypothetical protein
MARRDAAGVRLFSCNGHDFADAAHFRWGFSRRAI